MDTPDFFKNRDNGQLWLDDRRFLWDTLTALRPQVAAETGTWKGGGSTYFIASALKANGAGILYTVENNNDLHAEAVHNFYTLWPHLVPYVKFHLGDSLAVYRDVMAKMVLDFVFLDGNHDADVSLQEFQLFTPLLRIGGVIMVHDWYNGKAETIKPLVANNPDWKLTTVGDSSGTGTFESGSLGLGKLVKLH